MVGSLAQGGPNGIMDEPRVRLYLQDGVRPAPNYERREGSWLAGSDWPLPFVSQEQFALGAGSLDATAGEVTELLIRGKESAVDEPGPWCGFGGAMNYPDDQAAEDGNWLTFDSPALQEPMEIVGAPEVRLLVASDRPQAFVAVRLCDVWPDGASTFITRGVLNLTHREDHETLSDVIPGEQYAVCIQMMAIGYVLAPGHRLRLAVSPTYWPFIWPSPEPVTLTVATGPGSTLHVPRRQAPAGHVEPALPSHFDQPEAGPGYGSDQFEKMFSGGGYRFKRDVATGAIEFEREGPMSRNVLSGVHGLEYFETDIARYSITEGDPLSAQATADESAEMYRDDWRVRIETHSKMTADATDFYLTNSLEAYEGDSRVFAKAWTKKVPRDGM